MKIALYTVLNQDFIIGFKAFIKSFLYYNEWFDLDFIIMDIDLTENDRAECKRYYKNIIFKKPDHDNYAGIDFSHIHECLRPALYALDAFCQYEYDKVVAVDMDMIVLGDISPVFFDTWERLSGTKAYNSRKDRIINTLNTGLFVVGKEVLNEEIYNSLIESVTERRSWGADQKAINILFNDTGDIRYIDKTYNVEKRMFKSNRYGDFYKWAKVLHFIGLKPWQNHKRCHVKECGYNFLEDIWRRWE